MTQFTQPFDGYVDCARPYSQIWRTLLGLVLIVVFWMFFLICGYGALLFVMGSEAADDLIFSMTSGAGPTGILMLLGLFAFFWPALWLTLRFVHKRPLRSLFGPDGIVWRHFFLGIGIMALFGLVSSLLTMPFFPVERNLDLGVWLRLLPIGLILIFFQSCAEEMIFRGYLQQQLAARFQSPWIWMLIPSILFGLGHMAPELGANNLYMAAVLTVSGLIAADVTRRTGALALAMGLHVGNNILAILIISFQLPEGTASLWVDPTPMNDIPAIRLSIILTGIAMVFSYVIGLFVAQRITAKG